MLRDLKSEQKGLEKADISLENLGKIANHIAKENAFKDYRQRKADNTLRRQRANLDLFAAFLGDLDHPVGDLFRDPGAWHGITWGLVAAFQRALLGEGYALSTTNIILSTVKVYAKLAAKAETLDMTESVLIRGVEGYAQHEKNNVDQKRAAAGLDIRIGHKRATPVILTQAQVQALKRQPRTPQGIRDRVIMCLLCDHGLRVSELADLTWQDIDLSAGILKFERPKVGISGQHKLSKDSLRALKAWGKLTNCKGPLLSGSRKGGGLVGGMKTRAINQRVGELGKVQGLQLSPHDCRHTLATRLAKELPLQELMAIFGWRSPAIAMRYVQAGEISKVD